MGRSRTLSARMIASAAVMRWGPGHYSLEEIAQKLPTFYPSLDKAPNRSTIMRRLKEFRLPYSSDDEAYRSAVDLTTA